MVLDLRVGDVLRLRRKHPCGGFDWDVIRVGADIGVRCRECGRRVLLDRPTLRRRLKSVVERGAPVHPAIERALFGDPAGSLDEESERGPSSHSSSAGEVQN
jgi:hypothetical protein